MRLELFDRDQAVGQPEVVTGPMVKVDGLGRLLFNPAAWAFIGGLKVDGVSLLFDPETRTGAVRPESGPAEAPGTRFRVVQFRSRQWPKGLPDARPFVQYYRLRIGEYPARLQRGPGPRMVTFEAGRIRGLPYTWPMPGTVALEEDGVAGAGRGR